jgi:hypothetical protein
MNDAVKKLNQSPESYSPKLPFIIDLSIKGDVFPTDKIIDPFNGGEPPKTSNRILGYRRIQNWENFFLCSAICSMAKAVGKDENIFNKEFFSAITGDMFAYLYSKEAPSDSGITNSFFVPQVIKKCFAAFGYGCIYLSNEYIRMNFRTVMNAIKASVDNGIPVLSWGMGHVTMRNGSRFDPLPEASLIGGYDEGDILQVNLYPGAERMTVDHDGYTAITNGLNTVYGLFFVGEKLEKTNLRDVYIDVIKNIPVFLTLAPANGSLFYKSSNDGQVPIESGKGTYYFGRQAFSMWAEILEDDSIFENKTDEELNSLCWDLHCSPFCLVCTSDAYGYFNRMTEQYQDIKSADLLLPLFKMITDYKGEIWAYHGDFFPKMDKFRTHEFRAHIAEILRNMGMVCDKIIEVCMT